MPISAMRILLLSILGALPLMAAFPRPVQEVPLSYGQREAVVVFEADSPIRRAKSLCECTKVSYEGTRLVARVDTSGFSHPVEKQLEATTADGAVTRLTMRLNVPQAVVLSSPSLIWKLGSPATPQQLRITLPKGSPVHAVSEAALSGEAFEYSPRVVRSGAEYAVSVTPRSTAKKALNRLIIKTDHPDPRYAQYIIYLSIQP